MILDSTFLIDLMGANPNAINKLNEISKLQEEHFILATTFTELLTAINQSAMPIETKNIVREVLQRQRILNINQNIATKAGVIMGKELMSGKNISFIDSLTIAAAKTNDQKLLTKQDINVDGVGVETY